MTSLLGFVANYVPFVAAHLPQSLAQRTTVGTARCLRTTEFEFFLEVLGQSGARLVEGQAFYRDLTRLDGQTVFRNYVAFTAITPAGREVSFGRRVSQVLGADEVMGSADPFLRETNTLRAAQTLVHGKQIIEERLPGIEVRLLGPEAPGDIEPFDLFAPDGHTIILAS